MDSILDRSNNIDNNNTSMEEDEPSQPMLQSQVDQRPSGHIRENNGSSNLFQRWLDDEGTRRAKGKKTRVRNLEMEFKRLQAENKKLKQTSHKKQVSLRRFHKDMKDLKRKKLKKETENAKQIEIIQDKIEASNETLNKYDCQIRKMAGQLIRFKEDKERLIEESHRKKICCYCLGIIVKRQPILPPVIVRKEEECEEMNAEDYDEFSAAEFEEMKEMRAIVKYMSYPTVEGYKKLTFKYHRQVEPTLNRMTELGYPHMAQLDFPTASFLASKRAEGRPKDFKHDQSCNGVSCTCGDSSVDVRILKDYVFVPPHRCTKQIYEFQRFHMEYPPHQKVTYPLQLQPVHISKVSPDLLPAFQPPFGSKYGSNET